LTQHNRQKTGKKERKKERKKDKSKETIFHNIQQNMNLELENLPSILTFHFPLPSLMLFQPCYLHFTHLKKNSETTRHCEMLETTGVLTVKVCHIKQKKFLPIFEAIYLLTGINIIVKTAPGRNARPTCVYSR